MRGKHTGHEVEFCTEYGVSRLVKSVTDKNRHTCEHQGGNTNSTTGGVATKCISMTEEHVDTGKVNEEVEEKAQDDETEDEPDRGFSPDADANKERDDDEGEEDPTESTHVAALVFSPLSEALEDMFGVCKQARLYVNDNARITRAATKKSQNKQVYVTEAWAVQTKSEPGTFVLLCMCAGLGLGGFVSAHHLFLLFIFVLKNQRASRRHSTYVAQTDANQV